MPTVEALHSSLLLPRGDGADEPLYSFAPKTAHKARLLEDEELEPAEPVEVVEDPS